MAPASKVPIPITVFTGFLGAGKTSIILSLLPQLPKDYKVVLLKNEFGDVEVDSKLAQQSSLTAVSEILNGCMCCVLVGQMQTALLEIRDSYRPDRIIIECSGSAFPATLAFQIRELERETDGDFTLDAIVTVIDAENFTGYEDTSPTAKMQASYTDIILINKSEHVSERALDEVLDHLNTLNDQTPKIKTKNRSVDPELIFGLVSKLFLGKDESTYADDTHNDEVETITLLQGQSIAIQQCHAHHPHSPEAVYQHKSHDTLPQLSSGEASPTAPVSRELVSALDGLSKESVWRVKGFIRLSERDLSRPSTQIYILNWAFGRYELTPSTDHSVLDSGDNIKLTAMGEKGELKRALRRFCERLRLRIV